MRRENNKRFVLFISFNVLLRATMIPSQYTCYVSCLRHRPKSCRMSSVDVFPSRGTIIRKGSRTTMSPIRTFHHHLHTSHEAMDDTPRLSPNYPTLSLLHPIQTFNDHL